MYGGLYPRLHVERLYLPRSEGGSGGVSMENCVIMKGKTYALRSNEKLIIAATAELKLKKFIKWTRKKKTTPDRMERESSLRSVLEKNKKR